jgi:hypothetical protein
MLSIFTGGADFTATDLWNGRKIGGLLCNFLSRRVTSPLFDFAQGKLCALQKQKAAEA